MITDTDMAVWEKAERETSTELASYVAVEAHWHVRRLGSRNLNRMPVHQASE